MALNVNFKCENQKEENVLSNLCHIGIVSIVMFRYISRRMLIYMFLFNDDSHGDTFALIVFFIKKQ